MIDETRFAEFIRKKRETICCKYLPNGYRNGDYWVIGDAGGAEGNSLYIALSPDKAGDWYDFSTCEEGTLPGLLMHVLQVDMPGLVDLIERDFGVNLHLSESGCPTAPAPESRPQQEEQKDEPKQVPAAGGKQVKERDLVESLIERHGLPFYEGGNGRPGILNEPFFAGLYAAENHVLFESRERRFYHYSETDGLYHPFSEHQLLNRLEERLLAAARSWSGCENLELFRGARQLGGIIAHLKGRVEREDAFNANRDLIHVANGVLDLNDGTIRLRPFSSDLLSRNGIPIAYDPKATCPQFENKLLALIEPEDRQLLLKFFGQFLSGHNSVQRILILEGLPETGKSTTAEIAKLLIGPRNCAELRTKHLEGRFEIGRLCDRTLVHCYIDY